MIGLGNWKFHVDTMFYRGDAILSIADKDGKYDVSIDITEIDVPEFSIYGIEQDGNTITGLAQTDLLKGKEIPFSITFEDDTANGFLKVPFLGRIKLENGQKM